MKNFRNSPTPRFTSATFAVTLLTMVGCGSTDFAGAPGVKSSAKPKPASPGVADATPISSEPDATPTGGESPETPQGVGVNSDPPPTFGACSAASGNLIDFETLPNGEAVGDGVPINVQYMAKFGVSFALANGGSPVLATPGGKVVAYTCTSLDCSQLRNGARPGSGFGRYFLTDGSRTVGKLTSEPLIVTYENPVGHASGALIDIDAGESWTIEALGADGAVIDTVYLAAPTASPNQYDGLGMRWRFNHGSADIHQIRFSGFKQAGVAGPMGLAFDLFSPATDCNP